jgi:ppGpp synthetase/RelA/SpoT-type nucleotidyltranferase
MGDRKAMGYDGARRDVLQLLGESGLRIVTQLINNIYEIAEGPKDFTAVTMIAIRKKRKATKCSNHCTISLIANTANIIVRILT